MRALFYIVLLGALLWIAAFFWFIENVPRAPQSLTRKTDAIVVLTGGNGRVEQGLLALAQGDAPVLLVSGVGPHVTRAQLVAAHASPETQQKIAALAPEIVLDYLANSTQSNADQAAAFVAGRPIRSLRLVTANYHMPRSLLEFHAALPGVEIVPDPVFPAGYEIESWWQEKASRRLVLSEFGKYYAALFLRSRVER